MDLTVQRRGMLMFFFIISFFGGRIQMGREPVRIWLLGLTQRRSAYRYAQCYLWLSVFWWSLVQFRHSICLEFAACQSAKSPHCVWVQSISQDFPLHTGLFANLGRPFLCQQIICWCWSFLYSAILHSRADSLRSRVILHEWLDFHSTFLNIHQSGLYLGYVCIIMCMNSVCRRVELLFCRKICAL